MSSLAEEEVLRLMHPSIVAGKKLPDANTQHMYMYHVSVHSEINNYRRSRTFCATYKNISFWKLLPYLIFVADDLAIIRLYRQTIFVLIFVAHTNNEQLFNPIYGILVKLTKIPFISDTYDRADVHSKCVGGGTLE